MLPPWRRSLVLRTRGPGGAGSARPGDLVLVTAGAQGPGAQLVRVHRPPGRRPRRDRGADARPRPAPRLRRGGRARGASGGASGSRAPPARAATCARCRRSRSIPQARATSTTRSPPRRSPTAAARVWVHIADVAAHVPEARRSTARRAGARRACTCRARSSRCCRTRSRTTPARWSPARTARR